MREAVQLNFTHKKQNNYQSKINQEIQLNMQKTILSYGEILWDLLPEARILGGAPFNFAYRANALGERAVFVSRLGQDDLGHEACQQVRALGVSPEFLQWDPELPTGMVRVFFDANRNPDYDILPNVAYDRIDFTPALQQAVAAADCICFGTLIQRTESSRTTLAKLLACTEHSLKFLDINLRKNCYTRETIGTSLEAADILKLNETEAGDLARILKLSGAGIPEWGAQLMDRWHLKHCLVTLAERGVFAVSDTEQIYLPGHQVDLVDSLGAGDAFSAGFVHRILHGDSLKSACEFGNWLGALVASKKGATAPIQPEEIEAFRRQKSELNYHPELTRFS